MWPASIPSTSTSFKAVAGPFRERRGTPLTYGRKTIPTNSRSVCRLVFTFQASAPINFFNVQASQYETMCFAPYKVRRLAMSGRNHGVVRAGRRASKGQVMAIFALLAVLIFAVTGLAVDSGLSYLSYNGAERAAAAGALAGVPYMPSGFGGTGCDSGTADAAACAATARDGYANGSILNGNPVTVTVARYPAGCRGTSCSANKLTVSVSAYVQPTFLRILGFAADPVVASDTAFYLPPISLGQPGAQIGSSEDQRHCGELLLPPFRRLWDRPWGG